jgi:DNA-binding response OmpR family regulator
VDFGFTTEQRYFTAQIKRVKNSGELMSIDYKSKFETTLFSPSVGIDLDEIHPDERKRILVIDDEPENITLLKRIFMNEGYNVSGATSGKEGINKLLAITPSLVVLDLVMPDMNGEETFDQIRRIMNVPVVILSAVNQKEEIIRLLQKGADDYVTKPFDYAELSARVAAVLRRVDQSSVKNLLTFPTLELSIDLDTYEVKYHDTRIQMTGKMFEVLVLLARNAPKVVNYHEISYKVWGENTQAVRNRLKYLVYLLRQEFAKINPDSEVIENIDRLGYRISTGQ